MATVSKRRPLGPMVDVTVRAEVINTAIRANSGHCMIADAIKAAVPAARKVSVDLATCRWSDPARGLRYVYLTPRVAQEALVDFDSGVIPEPFKFRLRGAHVTRAGKPAPKDDEQAARARTRRQRYQAKKKGEKLPPAALAVPARATLASREGRGSGNVPDRVGGRRPPQLHLRREFGLRAFRAGHRAPVE